MISPLFEPGLWVGLVTLPCTSALLISHHLYQWSWETLAPRTLALVGTWTLGGAIAWNATASPLAWGVAAIGLILSWAMHAPLRHYYLATHILLPASVMNVVFTLGWSVTFITALDISPLTRTLLLINLVLGLILLPLGLITLLPTQSYLLRKRWLHPRVSLPPEPRTHYPKVSFHVPSYAEPPDVVCATLDALSQIRYPNFEVLLIDNNTIDPALWHPLKIHCESLNQQLASGAIASENHVSKPFQFFHLENLKGAKAGALNFALEHTAPDAEIISLIDADYQSQPDFLERLIGFFDDPNLGFVQTPHDYREWQNNVYLRACYWEYRLSCALQQPCLSEWGADFIIGTMCLIRRQALEQVGGWATWCLTEDSESAIRIHSLGYSSIFLTETFGRGLIPETFLGYKKQRRRWTIGPIQQFLYHWRLFLPNPWAAPSKLTFWQRALELVHSLREIQYGLSILVLPLAIATLVSIFYHQEAIALPPVLWWGASLSGLASLVQNWLSFRLLGCTSLVDMVMSTLASLALGHTRFMGALVGTLAPLFNNYSFPWQRTNKFKPRPNRLRALESVKTEICLALALFLLGGGLFSQASLSRPDLLLGLGLGAWGAAIAYLASPLMALLAEYELHRLSTHPSPKAVATEKPEILL